MQACLALLRVLAVILIGPLTALLAILAALLLLLATLFFVAISLRVLLVLLVGVRVVSHFPSPLLRHAIMMRQWTNPAPCPMLHARRRVVAVAGRVPLRCATLYPLIGWVDD